MHSRAAQSHPQSHESAFPISRRAVVKALALGGAAVAAPLLAPRTWAATAGAGATVPPLMLSTPYRAGKALDGYWVSEKYDGVRGYWDGHQLFTRAGNPVATPAWFTAGWPATPMDGELWAGRGQFGKAVSAVRQSPPADAAWQTMRFMVFDLPAHPGPFVDRLAALQQQVQQTAREWLQATPQTPATSEADLLQRLRDTVQSGGEGLMLHHGSALYTAQRSPALQKLKPFDDAEAQVLAHVPGRGRHQGRLGALWVELAAQDGQPARRFKLGTGLSDAQREAPPAVGSWVTFRYRGLTSTGRPRFASFLRVADDRAI